MTEIKVGTVSHGTLLSKDLIETFSWALRHLAVLPTQNVGNTKLLREADAWLQVVEIGEDGDYEELGSELVNDLIDALNELAPDGLYFGANEGDGSDFGFWPVEEFDFDPAPRYDPGQF
jgi:hypothetical protein